MWMPSQDHIVPVSRGGANTHANSRLVHLNCNVRRGNRELHDDGHFERVNKASPPEQGKPLESYA